MNNNRDSLNDSKKAPKRTAVSKKEINQVQKRVIPQVLIKNNTTQEGDTENSVEKSTLLVNNKLSPVNTTVQSKDKDVSSEKQYDDECNKEEIVQIKENRSNENEGRGEGDEDNDKHVNNNNNNCNNNCEEEETDRVISSKTNVPKVLNEIALEKMRSKSLLNNDTDKKKKILKSGVEVPSESEVQRSHFSRIDDSASDGIEYIEEEEEEEEVVENENQEKEYGKSRKTVTIEQRVVGRKDGNRTNRNSNFGTATTTTNNNNNNNSNNVNINNINSEEESTVFSGETNDSDINGMMLFNKNNQEPIIPGHVSDDELLCGNISTGRCRRAKKVNLGIRNNNGVESFDGINEFDKSLNSSCSAIDSNDSYCFNSNYDDKTPSSAKDSKITKRKTTSSRKTINSSSLNMKEQKRLDSSHHQLSKQQNEMNQIDSSNVHNEASSEKPRKVRNTWTAVERAQLLKAICIFRSEHNRGDLGSGSYAAEIMCWRRIAGLVPGRTARQCRDRWREQEEYRVVGSDGNPAYVFKRGRWNPEEITLLMNMKEEGRNWDECGKVLKRTPAQCKAQWHNERRRIAKKLANGEPLTKEKPKSVGMRGDLFQRAEIEPSNNNNNNDPVSENEKIKPRINQSSTSTNEDVNSFRHSNDNNNNDNDNISVYNSTESDRTKNIERKIVTENTHVSASKNVMIGEHLGQVQEEEKEEAVSRKSNFSPNKRRGESISVELSNMTYNKRYPVDKYNKKLMDPVSSSNKVKTVDESSVNNMLPLFNGVETKLPDSSPSSKHDVENNKYNYSNYNYNYNYNSNINCGYNFSSNSNNNNNNNNNEYIRCIASGSETAVRSINSSEHVSELNESGKTLNQNRNFKGDVVDCTKKGLSEKIDNNVVMSPSEYLTVGLPPPPPLPPTADNKDTSNSSNDELVPQIEQLVKMLSPSIVPENLEGKNPLDIVKWTLLAAAKSNVLKFNFAEDESDKDEEKDKKKDEKNDKR